jgi:hypothetical protein
VKTRVGEEATSRPEGNATALQLCFVHQVTPSPRPGAHGSPSSERSTGALGVPLGAEWASCRNSPFTYALVATTHHQTSAFLRFSTSSHVVCSSSPGDTHTISEVEQIIDREVLGNPKPRSRDKTETTRTAWVNGGERRHPACLCRNRRSHHPSVAVGERSMVGTCLPPMLHPTCRCTVSN